MRSDILGWVPCQLREATRDCAWRFVGDTPFIEPFFEETLGRCLSLPENSFGPPRVTGLSELPELARGLDTIEPSAFVFHVSRCGSTLVSQLLGLDDEVVCLSEVSFFDQLLRARFRPALAGCVDVSEHLPAAIRLHARRRTGKERFLVVKLDSWHVAFHAELRRMYPKTPFILLYRHPADVVRSHRKRPGMHAVPGLLEDAIFGFPPVTSWPDRRATYLPRVLEFYYETFLHVARTDPRTLLAAYQPDMVPVVESMAGFAGIELSAEQREKMRARAGFHGKYPAEDFRGDGPEKVTDETLRSCVVRYEALEAVRGGSPARGAEIC